ncbi:DUF7694 domain-containing protein [Weissella minor]|uniref:DUF7694 domain-containing protein n=1 Tax=Weissella minor TaxID=1620 RepID=A0A0R2JJP5_9LACO|nr:hypothetical protein [Weissella minor]KRN77475.1 hypothetical protein IV67_GL001529 [Weissella minor]
MKTKTEIINQSNVKIIKEAEDGFALIWLDWIVILSNGGNWEHVSISNKNRKRMPDWQTMQKLKQLIFKPDETAMQLHPADDDYISPATDGIKNGVEVLHLWRPTKTTIPLQPKEFV